MKLKARAKPEISVRRFATRGRLCSCSGDSPLSGGLVYPELRQVIESVEFASSPSLPANSGESEFCVNSPPLPHPIGVGSGEHLRCASQRALLTSPKNVGDPKKFGTSPYANQGFTNSGVRTATTTFGCSSKWEAGRRPLCMSEEKHSVARIVTARPTAWRLALIPLTLLHWRRNETQIHRGEDIDNPWRAQAKASRPIQA